MTTIKESERRLFAKWRTNIGPKGAFIEDGVVDERQFLQEPCRFVFVLKEANQMGKTSLTDFLSNGAPGNGGHTWNPVCRWLTGEKTRVFSPDERKDILRRIAVMNLKKEDGGSVTDMRKLEEVVKRDSGFIKSQMEIYAQHVPVAFICCGPWLLSMISQHVYDNASIEREAPIPFMKPFVGREVYFVAFNHPNAKVENLVTKFEFVKGLIKG